MIAVCSVVSSNCRRHVNNEFRAELPIQIHSVPNIQLKKSTKRSKKKQKNITFGRAGNVVEFMDGCRVEFYKYSMSINIKHTLN